MSIKSLTQLWALPDRSADRAQITLRLQYEQYARLHALKEIYPNRSVNDMLNDLIKAGLDEVIEALPFWKMSEEDAAGLAHSQFEFDELVGSHCGPRAIFDAAYERLLLEKAEEKPELKMVSNQEQKPAIEESKDAA